MNVAVLLRGFHYLARDRFGFPMDGRQYVESLRRCILDPLRLEHNIKVFVATYPSHVCDEMKDALRPDGSIILDSKTSNQAATFGSGIELVKLSQGGAQTHPHHLTIHTHSRVPERRHATFES